MQNDVACYGSASDLLDSHALAEDKFPEVVMQRSIRSSLDTNSVDIGEITESPDTEYMSTSAILHYCKSKILVPYLKLLTAMGLRPIIDSTNTSRCTICFSHFHSAQVAFFMVLGYILQYMSCFRRDRGFCYKLVPLALSSSLEYETYKEVCYGNVTLTYIGPSILHFVGFLYALYLFRISDNEQLQNLMERLIPDETGVKDTAGGLYVDPRQAQLLQANLMFLKGRLLNRSITPLNWMREIAEFRKLLKYLNNDLAPAVCLFTIVNMSWAVSGLLWLFNFDQVDKETQPIVGISVLNQVLWVSAAIVPFVQAARLSNECQRTRSVGHELFVRPFLHQDTPQEEVVSVLMYATTLDLQAKLFYYPIAGRYVCVLMALSIVILFAFGMCHYLQ